MRAEIDNTDGALKPEMFANFSIITGDDTAAPAVPEDAVVYEGETARVWVARDGKSLALRDDRVGRTSDGKVEVLSGLKPGEKVVTGGSLFIDRAAKGDVARDPARVMNAIIVFALKQRVLVVVLLVGLFVAGVMAFLKLNIEAYPDPVPPLVDIVTQSSGQSAEEIERYITIPIEVQMAGIPHVTADPHDLAVRPVRRQDAVHLRLHLRAGGAVGDQPAVAAAAAAQRRPAADFADEPDRRDLPLSRGRAARLLGDRPQDHPGLDAGAPLQGGAGRDRRHRLGRQDQDL